MSKHSKKYYDKQLALEEKAQNLREEIERESEKAEDQMIKTLKVVGVAGGIVLILFIISRAFAGKRKKKGKVKSKNTKTLLNLIPPQLQKRAFDMLMAYATKWLADFLSKKEKKEVKDS
ncbi:MAG: hypothetical protein KI790_12960 [Cyclobacteriaceae bacterium]|nr:hypothetical protein [Cyclobacteriaceae bacterium HetDA_MAG_MS6]